MWNVRPWPPHSGLGPAALMINHQTELPAQIIFGESFKARPKRTIIGYLTIIGFIPLNGYAPELNLDELVWSHMKDTVC
jgi:hypothetical protein